MKVFVIGAGGHGSEIRSYIKDLPTAGNVHLAGFIDDNRTIGPWIDTKILGPVPALTELIALRKSEDCGYLTAFGENALRYRIVSKVEELRISNLRPWSLLHPTAQIGSEVCIGEGTLLAPNVIVTTQVRIGSHCILNVKVSVSHDCSIGNFVNLNPAVTVCGRVTVGDGCYIGAGAVIKDRITIGRGVTVGAGAVVICDLPDGVTAVGVPARVIKSSSERWPMAL